jgi:hypothetical protein
MSHSREDTRPCPRGECDGEVAVTLEYEPGEMYGQDADGNRGMWVPGRWIAEAAETCTQGHNLDDAEREKVQDDAEQVAAQEDDGPDYEPEPDDYDD